MTSSGGLGFDAEIDYRQERVRSDFARAAFRRKSRARKAAAVPSPRQPILTPRPAL